MFAPRRERRGDSGHAAREPGRSAAGGIIHLQQTAGNAAVQRALAAQRDAVSDASRDDRFTVAAGSGDWTGAASILLAADERWMVKRLHGLDADGLRYLDDAVRRMGVKNSRLRIFVKAGLEQLGATDDTSVPGAGYGTIEGKATKITDGKLGRGGNSSASYKFEITFQPNAGAVDADEIDFIQMAKVVSTAQGTVTGSGEIDWQNAGANGANRQTSDHARVDRVPGKDQGWIGLQDDGTPGRHLRPWRRGAKAPAWMTDTPSRATPNVTFDFETAAICRKGPDQGKVYATVQWGFTIDGAMKVIAKDTKSFNKESKDFDLAVMFWNAEAAAPGSTEKPLPTNLR
jgi:hypothetical protein